MDAIQQLEVALLCSPASGLIDLLAERLQPSQIPTTPNVQHPQAYTTTQMAPPPTSVPMVDLTSSSSSSAPYVVKMTETPSKQCHIVPTLLQPSTESFSLPDNPPSPGLFVKPVSFLTVVVPKLAILPEAMPEQIDQQGGVKGYQCQLCTFIHTNRDCILTHICKHLNITIGCPMCGKGFQNVASLWKHGKKAHAIHIVESAEDQ